MAETKRWWGEVWSRGRGVGECGKERMEIGSGVVRVFDEERHDGGMEWRER